MRLGAAASAQTIICVNLWRLKFLGLGSVDMMYILPVECENISQAANFVFLLACLF